MRRTALGCFLLGTAFLLAGCPVISGTISDARTGEPIENAQVGVNNILLFAICGVFLERGTTDQDGKYEIALGSSDFMEVRAPGYLDQGRNVEGSSFGWVQDFQLQSIAELSGMWDVTLDLDGVGERAGGTFALTEYGVIWQDADGQYLGTARYEFDGSLVVTDGYLALGCDVMGGRILAQLALETGGSTLAGSITFEAYWSGSWGEYTGELAATRQPSQ